METPTLITAALASELSEQSEKSIDNICKDIELQAKCGNRAYICPFFVSVKTQIQLIELGFRVSQHKDIYTGIGLTRVEWQ